MHRDRKRNWQGALKRRLQLAVAGLAFCGGVATSASADELQPFRNVGDGYKAVQIITGYQLNAANRTMDLIAKEPNDPSLSRSVRIELAGRVAHDICANRTLRGGWTVRMFLAGETDPAVTCRTGASRAKSR